MKLSRVLEEIPDGVVIYDMLTKEYSVQNKVL